MNSSAAIKYDHQTKKNEEYKIFVAGIPSSISFRSILDFFSGFGKITMLEAVERGRIYRLDQDLCLMDRLCTRGICIITTNNWKTFSQIISGSIIFLGRLLMCKKYLKTEELFAHNKEINKKRVLVKGVPKMISSEELKAFIETHFGMVDIIYPFNTFDSIDNTVQERSKKPLVTYSVTLNDPETAEYLIYLRDIYWFGNSPMTFLPFKNLSRSHRYGEIQSLIGLKNKKIQEKSRDSRYPIPRSSDLKRKKINNHKPIYQTQQHSHEQASYLQTYKVVHKEEFKDETYIKQTKPNTRYSEYYDHSIKPTKIRYRIQKAMKFTGSLSLTLALKQAEENTLVSLNHTQSNLLFNRLDGKKETTRDQIDILLFGKNLTTLPNS